MRAGEEGEGEATCKGVHSPCKGEGAVLVQERTPCRARCLRGVRLLQVLAQEAEQLLLIESGSGLVAAGVAGTGHQHQLALLAAVGLVEAKRSLEWWTSMAVSAVP